VQGVGDREQEKEGNGGRNDKMDSCHFEERMDSCHFEELSATRNLKTVID